jgi:flagellar biosynthetic protein FliR
MASLETLLLHQFAAFTLVLARVGALMMTAPIFGSRAAPMQFRALFAVSITLLVTPLFATRPLADITQLLVFARYLINEAMVGLLLGLGIMILLSGIQLTGQIISQMSGAALANVFDPTLDNTVSVYSQLLYFLALTMFVLLDGHHLLMEAMLDTYTWLPPGRAMFGQSYVAALVTILCQSFLLGIRAAAPAMTALLLATLLLGLIGRTLPQINILAVGFGINTLLTLGTLLLSLGTIAWAFPQQTIVAIELLQDAVRETVTN